MTQDTNIPSLQISSAEFGSDQIFDAWREAIRPVFSVEPISETNDARERIKAWLFDELIFSDVSFSRQSFKHDAFHARDSNYVYLQIYLKGGCNAIIGNRSIRIKPQEIHVLDFSREFYSTADASDVVGVFIPHGLIGYDPHRHAPHMCFPRTSTTGRFLWQVFFALFDQLEQVKQSDARAFSQGFCGLLEGLLLPETASETEPKKDRRERLAEMQSYIARNLSQPDLGAERLCNIFNVSRPSLYRIFAESGGVASYISQRRLDRAYYLLASGACGENRVRDVAERLGYQDPAHFSRLFRRRFGSTPTEVMTNSNSVLDILKPDGNSRQNSEFGRLNQWLLSM